MCEEIMKADVRRRQAKNYSAYINYFTGIGLDIGCGSTPMPLWPQTISIEGYDQMLGSGDANLLANIIDDHYDFVVSSHCLEHMKDPELAFRNWLRVLKPGGYAVITVPDWDMYERNQWPSKFNGDHKTAWTICDTSNPGEDTSHIIVLEDFIDKFNIKLVSLLYCNDNFDASLDRSIDQTSGPAECAIEFIVRKI